GSGFVVSTDGLIVTNKHVVSDTSGTYQVITASDKKYDVKKIYRDPLNDIAILKIDPSQNVGETLKPVKLGDSTNLQVGQFVVAIGTALGEFRNTVTTGVISGLGRGIQAGDEFQGYVEQLDNVIQTSAPINPGNSGGPLVDSQGSVIGVNTAVAQSGQNIGFALPINVIKDSLNNFNQTGQFNRPYLGVAYKFIPKNEAVLNDIVQGAYVQSVVKGSPAEQAGIKAGDVIVKIDGQTIDEQKNSLAALISHKKVGDQITITVWRAGNTQNVQTTLTSAPNQ
ncbi:MAG: trypsin-like peptidase domain-containing protein, partial [Patescibacteria group bacterium]|nr:trypsin-like peptidase domain-containing protein [Patescibacteria group bacterium]